MFMTVPRFYDLLVSKGLEITVCMYAYSVPYSASTVVKHSSCNQHITFSLLIFDKIFNSIVGLCQGGFGGVPGMEAHGGYSFCGRFFIHLVYLFTWYLVMNSQ
jgi:hypothetical protein